MEIFCMAVKGGLGGKYLLTPLACNGSPLLLVSTFFVVLNYGIQFYIVFAPRAIYLMI